MTDESLSEDKLLREFESNQLDLRLKMLFTFVSGMICGTIASILTIIMWIFSQLDIQKKETIKSVQMGEISVERIQEQIRVAICGNEKEIAVLLTAFQAKQLSEFLLNRTRDV